jgi:hypothetical protein
VQHSSKTETIAYFKKCRGNNDLAARRMQAEHVTVQTVKTAWGEIRPWRVIFGFNTGGSARPGGRGFNKSVAGSDGRQIASARAKFQIVAGLSYLVLMSGL